MLKAYTEKEVDALPFVSAGRRHPPPPATPYLTEKILTMASPSNKYGDSHQRGSVPLPASPSDSVAQAMKNDLEELIGYIDNLAFEQKENEAVSTNAETAPTNKQLFPSDGKPTNTSYDDLFSDRNVIFRDVTNSFIDNVRQTNLLDRLDDSHSTLTATFKSPTRNREPPTDSIHERRSVISVEPKMLEPLGNQPRPEEPAGSPPPQEASMYFHDDSLSLNSSQSQDTGDNNIDERQLDAVSMKEKGGDKSEKPTRLLSTLLQGGIISSPERSKTITFNTISKDPTPSKAMRSTSDFDRNGFAAATGQATKNFDSNDENGTEIHSPGDLRRTKFGNFRPTPFPRRRDRDLDHFEQENEDRKGNEWWRARPISLVDPTPRHANICDPANENDSVKSVKWEEDAVSPLRERQFTLKGTPHPSSRVDDRRSKDTLKTPAPHQGKKSNLVLTSPDSAKKLLRSAMEALQDARKERDDARQWADDMKQSVNEWVEDQRRLIRPESASISGKTNHVSTALIDQKHQAIEDSIKSLRNEIKISKSDTETRLHAMMLKKDEQIQELSRQLTSVKQQLSRITKEDASKKIEPRGVHSRQPTKVEKPRRVTNIDAPRLATKTPNNDTNGLARSASRSETSNASSRGSHRTRRLTPSGGHLIDYGNGVTKELHPDGTTVTRFKNGDVETRFGTKKPNSSTPATSCMVAYYHSKEEVLQITQRDGSVLYEYANGQVERHCADGVKIVLFPDGTKTII